MVTECDSVLLEVKTDGNPTPTVAWYYENQKLLPNAFIEITSKNNIHTLKIPETVLDDEGMYTCIATNIAGEVTTETEVFVDEIDVSTNVKTSKSEPELPNQDITDLDIISNLTNS